ncbi:uncharacterized protein LOC103719024 [Phoenix dactylifera]|uniref:Uncharacterized protein LOC103719024 n=1 Tax=Phoenix dactylifera TaxID=42345 RepID=A0A8B7CTN2_PHODC|nr:uncharacterized protein LOC103719024 [Phoenix dactylifera]
MADPILSCFRCGAVAVPPASTATGPSQTTSIYETHLGLAALSWSRTVLGLSLRADLRCAGGGAAAATEDENDEDEESPRFRIRPWMFWKRRGSKLFHLKDQQQHRTVEFSWDLTRARFPACGGPEPSAGYFVAVVVGGEMLLVAGDLVDKAYRKTKVARGKSPWNSILISRREHVALGESGGGRSYKTRARFGGKEREISIDLETKEKERDVGMLLGVDGEIVLQVRRLRWKFRGSERVEVEGGTRIQVSWDLYNWFFQRKNKAPTTASAAAAAELGHAVFLFRFEWEAGKERHFVKGFGGPARGVYYYKGIGGYLGKNRNRSESSSGDGGGNVEGRRRGRKKSLLKTTCSSPSSSASSASSSTVMEWASPEETELQNADGFLLLVHVWKS